MANLLTISDLHIEERTRSDILNAISGTAENAQVDLILVGGDISEDASDTIAFMKDLNERVPAFYVPGNHDLWNQSGGRSTAESLDLYASDERCLFGRSLSVGERSVVVGHIGWYDYTFAGPSHSLEALRLRENDGRIWQDRRWVDFRRSDEDVCADFNARIELLMNQNEGKEIVLLTHMVGHRAFTVSDNTQRDWTYFNAFLGSEGLVRLASRASVAICGHVHYRRSFRENGTLHVCACLGYPSEWSFSGLPTDPATQVAASAFVFGTP